MATNPKPIAPDRGAPSPKPSRKVALDEVLRSLQDLVQNELNLDPAAPPPGAPAPSPALTPSAPVPADEPVVPAPGHPVDTARTGQLAPDPTVTPAVNHEIEYKPDATPNTAKRSTGKPAAAATGVQQELPYLDQPESLTGNSVEFVPTAKEPEPDGHVNDPDRQPAISPAEATGSSQPAPVGERAVLDDQLPDLPVASVPVTEPDMVQPDVAHEVPAMELAGELESLPPIAIETAEPPVAAVDVDDPPDYTPLGENIDLSDIPILEDAVELTDEHPDLPPPPASAPSALPAAQEARRLAIQVAARLNVSLRKAGKPVLTSDVIARLARELQEALANAASNMDNTRSEK